MNFFYKINKYYLLPLTLLLSSFMPSFATEEIITSDISSAGSEQSSLKSPKTDYNIPSVKKIKKKDKKQQVISDIKIEGNQIIRNSEIMNAMKMQVGDVYSPESIQRGLTEIYNMGWFTEKMRAVPVADKNNNIVLKIYVEENRPVTEFTITGNSVISAGEISEILAPLENQPQNISTLNKAVEKQKRIPKIKISLEHLINHHLYNRRFSRKQ